MSDEFKRIHQLTEHESKLVLPEDVAEFEERHPSIVKYRNRKRTGKNYRVLDMISGRFESPAEQIYSIVLRLPYAGKVIQFDTRTASGSVDCDVKLNGATVTGTSHTANATEANNTATADNEFAEGVEMQIEFSSLSSPVDFDFVIVFERCVTYQSLP